MDLQSALSRKKNQALIGTIQHVMMTGIDSDSGMLCGRTQAHAPEVDGLVLVESDDIASGENPPPEPGAMIDVKITMAQDYDLIGETLHG
jgi:ribosomal protein S12 methylthiotransferase